MITCTYLYYIDVFEATVLFSTIYAKSRGGQLIKNSSSHFFPSSYPGPGPRLQASLSLGNFSGLCPCFVGPPSPRTTSGVAFPSITQGSNVCHSTGLILSGNELDILSGSRPSGIQVHVQTQISFTTFCRVGSLASDSIHCVTPVTAFKFFILTTGV